MVVKREFGDAHLLLVRKPPSTLLEVLLHRRHWGYPGGVWYGSLSYVTARPATKAPVTTLYLRGRRCTAAPNEVNHQPRMYRNLCCTWNDAYVPAWHLRIVMWRC